MTAPSLLVSVAALVLHGSAPSPAPPPTGPGAPDLRALETCKDHVDARIFTSPRHPHERAPLRLLVASEHPHVRGRLTATDPGGRSFAIEASAHGLGPWGWVAELPAPAAGPWRVALWDGDDLVVCKQLQIRRSPARPEPLVPGEDPIWHERWKWEKDTENLYSLWVEHLFDAPQDEDVSWNPLSEALQDRSRNLLHDHLQAGEDAKGASGIRLKPDCADFPYLLRAYFAWKNGLPFGFRGCTRGRGDRAPTCGVLLTNLTKTEESDPVRAFEQFARKKVAGTVHSSTPRTLGSDDETDLYAVDLTRRSLRPGAVYADPYGHVMVVARWFPATPDRAGALFAVDAQPDGTIGRRHFWKGTFIFPDDGEVSGGGFKRFRPVVRTNEGMTSLSNAAVRASADYGDFSLGQWERGKVAFYDRMDELINPDPMPPETAFLGSLDALDQQLRRRIESVENGEVWKRERPGRIAPMPVGADIFLTEGPWEDFSTPARDLRLLVAIDSVLDFPERVARLPHRFVLSPGTEPAAVRRRLEELLAGESERRKFTYRRSDGSEWTLTLGQVIERRADLEVSWNPNDCVERRWGARPERDRDEYRTCKGEAPAEQRKRMEEYRHWFAERRRPAR